MQHVCSHEKAGQPGCTHALHSIPPTPLSATPTTWLYAFFTLHSSHTTIGNTYPPPGYTHVLHSIPPTPLSATPATWLYAFFTLHSSHTTVGNTHLLAICMLYTPFLPHHCRQHPPPGYTHALRFIPPTPLSATPTTWLYACFMLHSSHVHYCQQRPH